MMSREVNEIFAALAKAQIELKAIPFDSKNPHFGNEFASLTAIQDGTRPILAKHGLIVSQLLQTDESGSWLYTILGHSSGQYLKSSIKLIMAKNDMQAFGSASSYAKRYAWQAIVGVCGDEDDDGNAGVGNQSQRPQTPRAVPNLPPKAEVKNRPKNEAPATLDEIKTIVALCHSRPGGAIGTEVLQHFLDKIYGIKSSRELKRWQAAEMIQLLEIEDTTEATLMAKVALKNDSSNKE
jgi:hypothetical protein